MGRSLLLVCAAAMVMSMLAMGSMRRTTAERDARVTTYEADVIARENAVSALNQAVPFVAARFDSLVAGHAVDTRSLIGDASAPASRGLARRLTVASNRLRLTAGGPAQTLVPTRELGGGSFLQASVRVLAGGKVEILAEGIQTVTHPGGTVAPVAYKIRRVYSKASPLDAALIALAPAIEPSFTGNFRVDGRDTDPGSLLPTGQTARDRNGVKTNTAAVAQRIGAVVGASQNHRIMGVNGAGDIVTGATQADLSAIFDEAFAHPNRRLLTAASIGTATYGTASAPAVVVRNGDLTLTGTLAGTGVLVVNGDLRAASGSAGKLLWDGLVIVRKDASVGGASANLTAALGSGSKVTGSFVAMQGASAFVMPFQGRVQVNYLGSWDAGLRSSVGIEHARDGQLVQHQLVAPGANRLGDVTQAYTADLEAGEQVNFFIGVHYPTSFRDRRLAGTEAYKNYARGHFDAASGKPYGITQQTGPFTWRMAFEDLRAGQDIGFGSRPDWDYDVPGREDQVIEVQLQCRAYRNGQLVSPVAYEPCTPDNPDTRQQDVRLDWAGLTSGSGRVVAPANGTLLTLQLHDATVVHSAASIGRLTPLLHTLRQTSQLVMVDSWTSR